MKRVTTLLASLFLVSSFSAQAASIIAAERAFEQKDYAATLSELKPLVRDGDPEALYLVAVLYRDGLGVKADTERAKGYFESAARQGHLNSVNALRAIKNEQYKIEFKEVEPKALQGVASAQNRLGEMYEYGQGVSRDLNAAFDWYSQAAAQGLTPAIHNLARSYNFGSGVEVDYVKAEALYRQAANEGYAASMFFLGTLYATQNGNDASVNPDVLAYAWMHSAAGRGDLTARTIEQRLLMKLDEQGQSEAKDLARAFEGRFVTPFN